MEKRFLEDDGRLKEKEKKGGGNQSSAHTGPGVGRKPA
jgi:hypothetical protein